MRAGWKLTTRPETKSRFTIHLAKRETTRMMTYLKMLAVGLFMALLFIGMAVDDLIRHVIGAPPL